MVVDPHTGRVKIVTDPLASPPAPDPADDPAIAPFR
jgi:hypothetical protein